MVTQVVLLAGGKGTRMRELTETIPKPMVKIGEMPCLQHLMNIFNNFGKFEFIISTGYKSEIIENYFKDHSNVKVINTGVDTLTGGRVYRLSEELEDNFIVTYGDGLANVNIKNLIDHYNNHDGLATITVTNPVSRFGLVEFEKNNLVKAFIEKPKLKDVNINIGFFVFNKKVLNYLDANCTLEIEPLIRLVKNKELYAFKHDGYFEPMDTYREYLQINKYWESGNPPWMDFN